MSSTCSYYECTKPLAEGEDRFTAPTKTFCEEHKDEFDGAVKAGAKSLFGFWVRASGGAKEMARTMAPAVEIGAKMAEVLKDLKKGGK